MVKLQDQIGSAPDIGLLTGLTGFQIQVHDKVFPYDSLDPDNPGKVHAVIDRNSRAIYCSSEWLERLKAATDQKSTSP